MLPAIFAAGGFAAIVSTIIRFLVGTLIMRFILALGVSILTFGGVSSVMSFVKNHFLSLMSSSGSGSVVQLASAVGLLAAANILFSAYIGALSIRSAMGFSKRLVFGKS